MDKEKTNNDKGDRLIWIIGALFVFVVIAWCLTIPIAKWLNTTDAPSVLGTSGDVFGSVNALFSGLAFVGLIYAVLLQRQELSLQRQELRDTREVLASQKAEAEKQNATLAKQAFDNTFFQLIRLHHEIVGEIENPDQPPQNGRSAVIGLAESFYQMYCRVGDQKDANGNQSQWPHYFFATLDHQLGHYFENLYQTCKFVDGEVPADERTRYIEFVKAQLSKNEKTLLYYHCYWMSPNKFGKLATKLGLFSKAIEDKILIRDNHFEKYLEAKAQVGSA